MNSGKYVFPQILQFVNKYEFEKCVYRYKGDHRVRDLNCWNQFIQLFFGQLTSRNSLRDICLCLKAHKNKLYHLGIKQNLTIKTLWGHSENPVKVHVWIAICTYLIVAQVKYALKSTLSIYEIMQILSISVFDKTPVIELLIELQINQNVKEQSNLFSINDLLTHQ